MFAGIGVAVGKWLVGHREEKQVQGCAGLPNNTSTRLNRCEVLDGEGIGFAVRRVMPTLCRQGEQFRVVVVG